MGKRGLGQGVAKHKDPTFEKVLGNFRKEARALQEKKKAADAFSCIKALRLYLKMNGYEPADDLAIRDVYTGQVYWSVVPESKRSKSPKY